MSSQPSGTIGSQDGFASRLGYILSTIGMAVGVGAMWRFPMLCAKYGGGAFVFAFVLICVVVVIPAGWAESALGRKYKMSAVGALGEVAGKPGRAWGYVMGSTSLGLFSYYPAIMAIILVYIFKTASGADYVSDVSGFYTAVNDNRPVIYLGVVAVIALTAFVNLFGVQKGIERVCKILLPLMFIFLVILVIRVCTIPGIAAGIEFYVKPEWSQLWNPEMWATAAGMALFAVGLGPGCLLTYGMYLGKKADLATDFITVNVVQVTICLLAGFVSIPATVAFGLDPLAGKGLIFMSLPTVFSSMAFGSFFLILFFICLFFAGLSSTINQLEIPVSCVMEGFNVSRRKAVGMCAAVALILAIPCVWSDPFFAWFDKLIGDVFYCVCAAVVAFILAWKVGAKTIREQWYNPTSVIQWPAAIDFLYKYIAFPALAYFAITAIMTI
ncbi:MAG: sodium-dependent transporter [Planctomycetaceae bacterium]|nr:sodium-dependent transporter [Planctomycetaceae bacterium]